MPGTFIQSVLLLVGSAGELAAQAHPVAPDSVRGTLEPLAATVTRTVVVGASSALTVPLDSTSTPPAATLEDIVRRMPLIRARYNSRGETQLTLRGSESRQVSVTLDGIPLTIGWDNRTDLSVIPLTGAHRLSTVRGLSSLLSGPNVLGGVVAVSVAPTEVPASILDPIGVRATVAGGEAAAMDGGLKIAARSDDTDVLLSVGGGFRTRDYQPLAGSIDQPFPGSSSERLNSDFRQWNGFLSARVESDGGSWATLSSVAYGAERGVAPELHVSNPRLWRIPSTRRWFTVLGAGTGWTGIGAGGSVDLRAGIDVGDIEIEEYESLGYREVVGRETGNDRTLTLRAQAAQGIGASILRLSATGAETRHDEILDPGGSARYRQRFLSLAATSDIPLGGESGSPRFGLILGAALDGSNTPETGGLPSRQANWDWGAKAAGTYTPPGGSTRLHAGLSRRTRAPSLRELYSGALGRFIVNPNLGPETLAVAEIGITHGGPWAELQAVGFHQRLTDAVVRVSAGDGRFQRVNRDRVLSTGLELVGAARWKAVDVRLDLTLQDVLLEDPAAPEDQREPEYQPWIAGSAALGGRLPADFVGRVRVAHVGRQFCVHPDLDRDVALPAATWADLEVSRAWRLGGGGPLFRLSGGVQNVTDASVYDQCGLPSPGRRLILTVRLG